MIGPSTAPASAVEGRHQRRRLRRAPLLALGECVTRLEIDADYILFGHTHRAGPLPGRRPSEWRAPLGARLLNIGSWVDEPAFLGLTPGASPYRFGFAAQLVDDGPPGADQPARLTAVHAAATRGRAFTR